MFCGVVGGGGTVSARDLVCGLVHLARPYTRQKLECSVAGQPNQTVGFVQRGQKRKRGKGEDDDDREDGVG